MYRRILVLVDGSATSQKGLDEALRVARFTEARLHLFHVLDELGFALSMDAYEGRAGAWLDELRDSGKALLETARATAEQAGVEADTVLCEAVSKSLHEVVNAEVAKSGVDLIVMGTHGRRGLGRAVLGSNAEQILRHAEVPILLVRAGEVRVPSKAANEPAHVHLPSGALAFE